MVRITFHVFYKQIRATPFKIVKEGELRGLGCHFLNHRGKRWYSIGLFYLCLPLGCFILIQREKNQPYTVHGMDIHVSGDTLAFGSLIFFLGASVPLTSDFFVSQ